MIPLPLVWGTVKSVPWRGIAYGLAAVAVLVLAWRVYSTMGVITFTKIVAKELAPYHVNVNATAPVSCTRTCGKKSAI